MAEFGQKRIIKREPHRQFCRFWQNFGEVLVFDLGHNRYRLITTVFFGARELYIRALPTHKEYDREEWKKWC